MITSHYKIPHQASLAWDFLDICSCRIDFQICSKTLLLSSYARANYGKFEIRFQGPSVWNTIGDNWSRFCDDLRNVDWNANENSHDETNVNNVCVLGLGSRRYFSRSLIVMPHLSRNEFEDVIALG